MRRKLWAIAAAVPALAALGAFLLRHGSGEIADPENAAQVARGRLVYAAQCAHCHGDKLEGQADWRTRQPNGRLPAPPHDATGHTWHHSDQVLFGITKYGITPPYGPAGYDSDMPAFADVLSDSEINAVIAYLKSLWPPDIRDRQRRITEQTR